MIIEVLALGYTWLTGQQTIFHAAEYSMGFSIMWHTWLGHLVGGLTWEPLTLFVLMEVIWADLRCGGPACFREDELEKSVRLYLPYSIIS